MVESKPKLIRITTVPVSLKTLLKGQHRFMSSHYEVVGVSSSGKWLEEVSESEGICTEAVEMTRTLLPLKDFNYKTSRGVIMNKPRSSSISPLFPPH